MPGAAPGERTADRSGYRAGYYSHSLVTRIGKLELRVPRDVIERNVPAAKVAHYAFPYGDANQTVLERLPNLKLLVTTGPQPPPPAASRNPPNRPRGAMIRGCLILGG